MRRHKTTGELEWTVDNSHHNRTTTVWSRRVKPDDAVEFRNDWAELRDVEADTEILYFQGYYSGLLHFTFHHLENGRETNNEFKFDYPPKEGEAVYGIRGKIFEVLEVDNTKMKYRWINIPD